MEIFMLLLSAYVIVIFASIILVEVLFGWLFIREGGSLKRIFTRKKITIKSITKNIINSYLDFID
jgi:hypothetical protein